MHRVPQKVPQTDPSFQWVCSLLFNGCWVRGSGPWGVAVLWLPLPWTVWPVGNHAMSWGAFMEAFQIPLLRHGTPSKMSGSFPLFSHNPLLHPTLFYGTAYIFSLWYSFFTKDRCLWAASGWLLQIPPGPERGQKSGYKSGTLRGTVQGRKYVCSLINYLSCTVTCLLLCIISLGMAIFLELKLKDQHILFIVLYYLLLNFICQLQFMFNLILC